MPRVGLATEESQNFLIVTLLGNDESDSIKKRVSKISGVTRVDYNVFSQKLTVRYGRSTREGVEPLTEIRRVIGPYTAPSTASSCRVG